MNTTSSLDHRDKQPVWLNQFSLGVSIALLWLVLAYGVERTILPRGIARPLCVLVGEGGLIAGLGMLLFVALGAMAAGWITRVRDGSRGMLVVSLALAAWAYSGGTVDNWLKYKNVTVGPPTGAAYAPLIGEYLYWAVVLACVYFAAGGSSIRRVLHQENWRKGLTASLITIAVAAVLILILSGPRLSRTYHGQVYFSVAVGFILAVMAANRVCGAREPLWYLPAPIVVGLIGVVYAMVRPGLGVAYANINIIPANGLVRPLPIEMSAVGIAAILLTLRAARRLSSD